MAQRSEITVNIAWMQFYAQCIATLCAFSFFFFFFFSLFHTKMTTATMAMAVTPKQNKKNLLSSYIYIHIRILHSFVIVWSKIFVLMPMQKSLFSFQHSSFGACVRMCMCHFIKFPWEGQMRWMNTTKAWSTYCKLMLKKSPREWKRSNNE